ncbi:hypothetical protein ZOSMA_12G00070 [Zostera marina]|uniref:Uncharacterized protein n=1 Tax=Zostera marina TaxID=29655 RepID=A0A0K9PZH3_ZOSMR|nr:hypothetical protein ZOSMA_12G00070 [Zostera marina]
MGIHCCPSPTTTGRGGGLDLDFIYLSFVSSSRLVLYLDLLLFLLCCFHNTTLQEKRSWIRRRKNRWFPMPEHGG